MKVKYKTKGEVTPFDTSKYSCLINGSVPEKGIELTHSKAVALESAARRAYRDTTVYSSDESSHNRSTARINTKTGRILDKGIQLYRLWFRFLKLALELEEMKVSLVERNETFIKDTFKHPDIPKTVIEKATRTMGGARSAGIGSRTEIFREKIIKKVKVKRSAYKGWDLDQVLTDSFDNWWKTHSHLFEGYAPSFLKSKDEWIDNDDFIYIRIDKTSQRRDIQAFLNEEISPRLKGKSKKLFKVDGKSPRVNVIQNNYNALVLTLEGWSAKEIVGHKNIYIRRTDESSLSTRGDGLRPKYSTDKSMVSNIAKNKMHGVHHLLEVCEGRFGLAPTK